MHYDFNISGCCVSREIFNVNIGNKYEIGDYTQCLIFNISSEPVKECYHITDEEVESIFDHNFTRRVLKNLINNTTDELLCTRKGEWLIIDTHYMSGALTVIEYPDGNKRYLGISSHYRNGIKVAFEKYKKFTGCKVYQIAAHLNIKMYLEKTVSFIKKNWGEKIILINAPRAQLHLDQNTMVVGREHSCTDSDMLEYNMCNEIIKSMRVFFIDIPKPLLGDDYFDFKGSAVHYISETFIFLKKSVDLIFNNYNNSFISNDLDIVRVEYLQKIGQIMNNNDFSLRNAASYCKQMVRNKTSSNNDRFIKAVDFLVSNENTYGYYLKARIMYKRGVIEEELLLIKHYLEEAVKDNVPLSKGLLCHVLWDIQTDDSITELIKLIKEDFENGGSAATGWMGMIYACGLGVEPDIELSKQYLKYASDNKVSWAKKEYEKLMTCNK